MLELLSNFGETTMTMQCFLVQPGCNAIETQHVYHDSYQTFLLTTKKQTQASELLLFSMQSISWS